MRQTEVRTDGALRLGQLKVFVWGHCSLREVLFRQAVEAFVVRADWRQFDV